MKRLANDSKSCDLVADTNESCHIAADANGSPDIVRNGNKSSDFVTDTRGCFCLPQITFHTPKLDRSNYDSL